jgi:hypothetical protein
MNQTAVALLIVVVSGFILGIFNDTINDVRLERLNDTPTDRILERLFLYSLMPLLWFAYLFFSIFAVMYTANASGGTF